MAKEYLDIFDRFDGGGAGQMGDRFAGGGILSMIANEFFTPYGSEDDDRKRRLLEMRGLFDADLALPPRLASSLTCDPSLAPFNVCLATTRRR